MKVGLASLAASLAVAAVAAVPATADDLSPEALLAQYQPVTVLSQGKPVGPAFQDDWLDPLATIAGYPVG